MVLSTGMSITSNQQHIEEPFNRGKQCHERPPTTKIPARSLPRTNSVRSRYTPSPPPRHDMRLESSACRRRKSKTRPRAMTTWSGRSPRQNAEPTRHYGPTVHSSPRVRPRRLFAVLRKCPADGYKRKTALASWRLTGFPRVDFRYPRAHCALDADLCGTAALLKERVIVPEVATERNWPDQFRDLAIIVATA